MDIQFISVLLSSAWASGINMYLTIAILGIAHRFHWIELPGSMDTFSHPIIILLALVMFVVEFFADKIPYVDSSWDAVHTFIRPIGGALIGIYAMSEAGPLLQVALGLLTGTIAFEAHATKASTRAAINTSPEPFSNTIASVGEDASVMVLMYLMIQHPVVAAIASLALIFIAAVILKFFFSFFKNIFSKKPKKEVLNT